MKRFIKIIVLISFCLLFSMNKHVFVSAEKRIQTHELTQKTLLLGVLNGQSENSCTTNFCVSNAEYISPYYSLSTTVSFYLDSDILDFTTTLKASFNQYSTNGNYNYLTFNWDNFEFIPYSSFSATSQYTYLTRVIGKNFFDIGDPYYIVEETNQSSSITLHEYEPSTFQLGDSSIGGGISWMTPQLPAMTYYLDSGIPDFMVTGAVFSLSGKLKRPNLGQAINTLYRAKFGSEYLRSYYYFDINAFFRFIFFGAIINLFDSTDIIYRRTSIASKTDLLIHIAE